MSEDAAAGTNVGSPVSATDADPGDTLTYALGGADAASFTIAAASGQIRTSAALDYETKASYTVTVTANDGTVDSDSITVTINVTQVVVAVHDCARGAVADASNTGLVSDCEALLGARNVLEGNARLNWSDRHAHRGVGGRLFRRNARARDAGDSPCQGTVRDGPGGAGQPPHADRAESPQQRPERADSR